MSRPAPRAALLAMGLLAAVALRLHLAWHYVGNFDQESYEIVRGIFERHGNVYAETTRYNYSPVWFFLLGGLGKLANWTGWSFHFCVRGFLTGVDAATGAALVVLARRAGLKPVRAALCFLLNPAPLLVTGYHGQFDNLATFFLVASLAVQAGKRELTGRDKALAWALAAVAVLVKQIVIFAPFFVLHKAFPDWRRRFVVACAAALPFFASFLPFLPGGLAGIRQNVFAYAGIPGLYGLTSLSPALGTPHAVSILKLVLFASLLGAGLFVGRRDPLRASLLSPLLFLVLSPGIGEQYFVLPVVFGALFLSWPFLLYSLAAGAFLLASGNNLAWPPLAGHVSWNYVWAAAVVWLGYEGWHWFREAREPASVSTPDSVPAMAGH